jgi:hypothetical protein
MGLSNLLIFMSYKYEQVHSSWFENLIEEIFAKFTAIKFSEDVMIQKIKFVSVFLNRVFKNSHSEVKQILAI